MTQVTNADDTMSGDVTIHNDHLLPGRIQETADKPTKEEISYWRKWKDKDYRGKVIRSLCIGLGFFCIGVSESQSGPTFLDIQIITNTDTKTASFFFTVHSIGYLLGCVLAGILSKKFRRSLKIFVNLLAIATTSIVTPYCSHLATMMAIKLIGGIFAGVLDTQLNADHMRLWGNHGQVLMQLLHFMFAIGGLISPLISEPFLADKDKDASKYTSSQGFNINYSTNSNDTTYLEAVNWTLIPKGNNSDIEHSSNRETNVHHAFLITGIMTFGVSILFLLIYLKENGQDTSSVELKDTELAEKDTISYRKIPRRLHYVLVFILSFFFMIYCAIEDTFSALLMTFLVREYDDVTKSEAAHILTIFWICFACSRFLMIFLAKRFSPLKLLTSSISLMLVSFVTFTLLANLGHIQLVTFISGMVGLSMSGIFAAGFSWSESEYLHVTNSLSACILIACTLGVMFNPLLVVYSMVQNGNVWFCYIFTIEVAIFVTIFIILVMFNRRYVNRRFGPLRVIPIQNMQNTVENGKT